MHQTHPIPPVYDGNSSVLILGSFPSVQSRANGFFYGHPQNRFWKVLEAVFGQPIGKTTEEKKSFLLSNRVAVWDVTASCDIEGSSDSSIKNVVPNDIARILHEAPIKSIYVNGKTAEKLYNKYLKEKTGRPAVYLPSTSPANAAWTLEKLITAWSVIKN